MSGASAAGRTASRVRSPVAFNRTAAAGRGVDGITGVEHSRCMADRTVLRRGAFEAAVYFLGGVVVAVVAAVAWSVLGDRTFLGALGLCLLVVGAAVCFGTLSAFSRFGTADAMAALGRAPEGGGEPTTRVLTGIGLALLVGGPLLLAGTAVQYME